jgi:hypothetical protein
MVTPLLASNSLALAKSALLALVAELAVNHDGLNDLSSHNGLVSCNNGAIPKHFFVLVIHKHLAESVTKGVD